MRHERTCTRYPVRFGSCCYRTDHRPVLGREVRHALRGGHPPWQAWDVLSLREQRVGTYPEVYGQAQTNAVHPLQE